MVLRKLQHDGKDYRIVEKDMKDRFYNLLPDVARGAYFTRGAYFLCHEVFFKGYPPLNIEHL